MFLALKIYELIRHRYFRILLGERNNMIRQTTPIMIVLASTSPTKNEAKSKRLYITIAVGRSLCRRENVSFTVARHFWVDQGCPRSDSSDLGN